MGCTGLVADLGQQKHRPDKVLRGRSGLVTHLNASSVGGAPQQVSLPALRHFFRCKEHFKEFGRHYYWRYDFDGLDKDEAEATMKKIVQEGPKMVTLQQNLVCFAWAARTCHQI